MRKHGRADKSDFDKPRENGTFGGGVRSNRVWQICYPVLVYYLFYVGLDALFRFLLGERVSPLFCLMLSAAGTLVPIYFIYRKLPVVRPENIFEKSDIKELPFAALIVAFGVALNVLVAHLPEGFLDRVSSGYASANEVLFSDGLPILVLANVVLIPALEELLYRGILCGQLMLWHGKYAGAILSAIFFGIFHFNVVQFLYAFLVGVCLGLFYCRRHKLYLCWLAHAATNLIVILATR